MDVVLNKDIYANDILKGEVKRMLLFGGDSYEVVNSHYNNLTDHVRDAMIVDQVLTVIP